MPGEKEHTSLGWPMPEEEQSYTESVKAQYAQRACTLITRLDEPEYAERFLDSLAACAAGGPHLNTNDPVADTLNAALLAISEVHPSELHTFEEWNSLGGYVKRGSHGIDLITPDDSCATVRLYPADQVSNIDHGRSTVPMKGTGLPFRPDGFPEVASIRKALTPFSTYSDIHRAVFSPLALRCFAMKELVAEDLERNDPARGIERSPLTRNPYPGKVEVRFPEKWTHRFEVEGKDGSRKDFVKITVPTGTTATDGTSIERWSITVPERFTQSGDGHVIATFPTTKPGSDEPWMVFLNPPADSDAERLSLPATELKVSVDESRRAFLASHPAQGKGKHPTTEPVPKLDPPVKVSTSDAHTVAGKGAAARARLAAMKTTEEQQQNPRR